MTFFGKAYAFLEQPGNVGEATAPLQAIQSAVSRNNEDSNRSKAAEPRRKRPKNARKMGE